MATRFDPFRELDRFAQTLRSETLRGMPMDLYRQDDRYVLSVDLPGIDPGSVDIDVDGQLLTIRAERTLRGADGVQWLTREREGGSFLRQLSLGQGLDTEGITAHYENGVLTVLIPVSEKAKPRRIEVQSGSSASLGTSGEHREAEAVSA
ncbi:MULTISPECIES: Hsp20/alpha crystallin family protein [Arthrobacter]|uniref:Hsp20/alpha crystallin family protein n=1 Tax=Arthrobacter caoxuetaonis TaxID=2886935 RepID=A0A9X1MFK9_9MICC|nr:MULTISPECIES: Hsp20/alpha crystallin family protein [Arthrobacter]MCC3281605.1 Hsp20/alpha crystallin family protein [Arthrobacter caoxuetaonis]MCC3298726.1 Hsp20/alpha crystallin family protein [Arthrobacter caoxuetaonis]MCC9194952.1 Hsp20/alpha crystallin family protein [Arthrobacter sp. zg-Y916]USQ57459.1 Hsp20/alpha crystallin family protein [Arthrobacter caoxuetaonis]